MNSINRINTGKKYGTRFAQIPRIIVTKKLTQISILFSLILLPLYFRTRQNVGLGQLHVHLYSVFICKYTGK